MTSSDKNENCFRHSQCYILHYRIKQSGLVPPSKKKLIALIEIVSLSSVHDIYCFANIFDPYQA